LHIDRVILIRPEAARKEKIAGGQRNPLKKPDSDKEIKGSPSAFL
jgi:hypothetical protein